MISSAVLATHTVRLGGTAEAPTSNSSKPRPGAPTPAGASKTAHSHIPMKEATTYGHQGTRPRHEDHHDRSARREDHHDHPRRQPVTAPTPGPVDLGAVERDLAAVLAAHGLTGDTVNIAVYPINQADTAAGWSVTGMVYTPPPGVPAPRREPAVSPLTVLADRVEAMS